MKFYRYILEDISSEHIVDANMKLLEFDLVRETNKGYWINNEVFLHLKWISKTSRKRFAYPTKEEALVSFKARCRKRLRIAEHQVKLCHIVLNYFLNEKT